MLWLKRIVLLLLLIIILLLTIAFLDANETVVSLDLLLWKVSTTTGKALVAGFALSLVLVLIATYPLIVSYKFRLNRMQKRILKVGADSKTVSEPKS